jgi:hypothetical protein
MLKADDMKCYLVTGAAGFIGYQVVDYILKHHHQVKVVCVDRTDYCFKEPEFDNPNFVLEKAEITNPEEMLRILKSHKCDAVLHLATQTHTDNSFGNSFTFTASNVFDTHVLLETCRVLHPQVKRFVHISTDEVLAGRVKQLEQELRDARAGPVAAAAEAFLHPRPVPLDEPAEKRLPPPAPAVTAATVREAEDEPTMHESALDGEAAEEEYNVMAGEGEAKVEELERAMRDLATESKAQAERLAELERDLDIARRFGETKVRQLGRVEAERDSLMALVTTSPEDDDQVGKIASTLVQNQQELSKVVAERDSLAAVLSAEDELAKDRDRLQSQLARAGVLAHRAVGGGRLAEMDKLALRVEELEGVNRLLKEKLAESPDIKAVVVVGTDGRAVVTQEAFAEVVAQRDQLAEIMRTEPGPSPAASVTRRSAAAQLFEKLQMSPVVKSREEVLAGRVQQLEKVSAELVDAKNRLTERLMEVTNDSNVKELFMRKQAQKMQELNDKVHDMEATSEQTASTKIIMARRLESLNQENKALKLTIDDLQDQVAVSKDVSKFLNSELEESKKPMEGEAEPA